MSKANYIYAFGDGDKIREKVENYLFNHDLEGLTTFSQNLTSAISQLKENAIATTNAKVIVAGGDDILLCIPRENYQKS